MKADDFSEEQRRHLVAIQGGVAFVPPSLPRQLELGSALWRLEGEALREIGGLEATAEEFGVEQVLFPLQLREARLSNEIEGTHTQVEELLTAVAVPRMPLSGAVREVLATAEALEFGTRWVAEGGPLGHSLVQSLHQRILATGRGSHLAIGAYRTRQVVIGRSGDTPTSARFVPPPAEQVRALLDDLYEFAESERIGPVFDAALLHYQFEAVHPFEDGNGRVGRALIPLLWLSRGFLQRPIVYLGGYFAEHRNEYMDRLLRVSTRGEWNGWLEFFARGVVAEAKGVRARLRRVRELIDTYRGALVTTTKSPTARDALSLLLTRPMVSVSAVQHHTGASRPAAQQAIRALMQVGALKPAGRFSGSAVYLASDIERALFGLEPTTGRETAEVTDR